MPATTTQQCRSAEPSLALANEVRALVRRIAKTYGEYTCYNPNMELVKPSHVHLASYVDALNRGWSPDGTPERAQRILNRIAESPEAALAQLNDPHGSNAMVTLPDGSVIPCLPGIVRWMWDGEFCGRIWLRWSGNGVELPPVWLGHVAYDVVPWKQRLGFATAALAQILPEARKRNLPHIEVVANVENVASQRVILANEGVLVERFVKLPVNGGGEAFRFRITL